MQHDSLKFGYGIAWVTDTGSNVELAESADHADTQILPLTKSSATRESCIVPRATEKKQTVPAIFQSLRHQVPGYRIEYLKAVGIPPLERRFLRGSLATLRLSANCFRKVVVVAVFAKLLGLANSTLSPVSRDLKV